MNNHHEYAYTRINQLANRLCDHDRTFLYGIATRLLKLERAMERLSSMEAFDLARGVHPQKDIELIARIKYAERIAKNENEEAKAAAEPS
jgi:hypothetical protein